VITIPGISSVPHSVDLLTTIGRGITIIAGSRDGSLITGNVNELHLKGRDAVYTEQFGILPVKIVAESECIFAFSGCKAIKMDFVDSQTRITPILTEEKVN
jgi:hypothetical protein